MKLVLAAAAVVTALAAAPANAAAAPRVSIATLDDLPQPLPIPYDTEAVGKVQVDAARKRAKASHKLLLIDLGGNWCPDCRVLAGVMAVPEVKAFLSKHYEVVTVDIGRRDKNLDVAEAYGASVKGVPMVMIVDPVSGKTRNPDRYAALSDARNMTPQALADWLAQWAG
ncbi:thioredoxin family protein [Polymorphobacter sp. PAMC 29334]|uniref:thioredoxin family protein n=1 Tax=Polymorphobacter sp. PAMC 29334 TaxID=2862331 RepID=UPI001C678190|nr:thioredoxin family protein [Polymorphobacter sp. PAMC 29334]QYE34295.1 thioredoxin family protein [Polymorphobacter sp. PAMC 29334]